MSFSKTKKVSKYNPDQQQLTLSWIYGKYIITEYKIIPVVALK